MTRNELVEWFQELLERRVDVMHDYYTGYSEEGVQWRTEATAAIAAGFPQRHSIRQQWDSASDWRTHAMDSDASWMAEGNARRGILKAALEMLSKNRIASLVDIVRLEAEEDILTQAEQLLRAGYLAGAAGLAGGALEMHLKRLCEKHGLAIQGHGAIEKYDGAISKARNEGVEQLYGTFETKQIKVWGDMRNEAAHAPGAFKRTDEQVRNMIEDVRTFIGQWS